MDIREILQFSGSLNWLFLYPLDKIILVPFTKSPRRREGGGVRGINPTSKPWFFQHQSYSHVFVCDSQSQ